MRTVQPTDAGTANGLDPDWDHSGWPFRPEFTPFTVAAVVLNGLVVVGIVLTLRRRGWAGYWLAAAILLGAAALWIHFLDGQETESPSVIMRSYDDPAIGIPALIVLFGLLAAVVAMAWQAIQARRSGFTTSPWNKSSSGPIRRPSGRY